MISPLKLCGTQHTFGFLVGGIILVAMFLLGSQEPHSEQREGIDTLRSRGAAPLEMPRLLTLKGRARSEVVRRDTSTPGLIAPKPCTLYEWFRRQHQQKWEDASFTSGLGDVRTSLHEFTCWWAASQHELSLDSTRLPRYVEIMSDTLRLSKDAFAYAVQLRPPPIEQQRMEKTMYFVANLADSLYYRRLRSKYATAKREQQFSIRGLRTLTIPGVERTYLWLELESLSRSRRLLPHPEAARVDSVPARAFREWQGFVFSYDETQGLRYLLDGVVPIRGERIRAGEIVAFEQWDVSFPEPGIMMVDVREREGEVLKNSPYFASPDWLGPHVIDREAVADSSVYRYLLEEPEIWER